jgi:hypothetical protein
VTTRSRETPNPDIEYDGGHMGKGRMGPEHSQEGLKSEEAHRDIGNPVGTGFMQIDSAISEIPIRDKTAVTRRGRVDHEHSLRG